MSDESAKPTFGPDDDFAIESLPFVPTVGLEPLLEQIPNRGGVFWLTAADEGVVLMDTAGRLRDRIAGYLAPGQTDEPSRRADLRAVSRAVHFAEGHSPFEVNLLFANLARRHFPKTYRELLRYRGAWFVKVNPTARVGRFMRSNKVFVDRCRYFGPLADKHAAARYVELIEDTFGLCRCEQAYNTDGPAEHCLFFDMGKCLGLGVGAISTDDYRRFVERAADFAADLGTAHRAELTMRMKAAAADLRFEEAAEFKAEIEKLAALDARKFAHVRDADDWRMLIIQPAPGRRTVRPFVFIGGRIRRFAPVRLKDFAAVAAKPLLRAAGRPIKRPAGPARGRLVADGFALLAHHLFNRTGGRGLFLPVTAETTVDALIETVAVHFAPRPRKPAAKAKPDIHHPDVEGQSE